MKLKQVLAVMLSSVMVLSAAPTEVFAFDDPGFLTDSSGGTADEGSEQLEAGNASAASAEADGNFDEGAAQEDIAERTSDVSMAQGDTADAASGGNAVQGDISEAASDGNAEQNNIADVAPDGISGQNDISDEISNEEELQQDMQGGDSLEKEETDAAAIDVFSDGESADSVDTQTAKSVTASGAVNDNVTWTLYEDGELVISGNGLVPPYYSETSVPWNSYKSQITSLTVEDGITYIGDYAFFGCGILENVTIADSVVEVGRKLFEECTSLEHVTLSKNLKAIPECMFTKCVSLTSIDLPDSIITIGEQAFAYCTKL